MTRTRGLVLVSLLGLAASCSDVATAVDPTGGSHAGRSSHAGADPGIGGDGTGASGGARASGGGNSSGGNSGSRGGGVLALTACQ